MQTPYARRITLAAVISLAAHAVLLVTLSLAPQSAPVEASVTTPVRVRLEPPPPPPEPEQETPRRLVDAVAEDEPPEQSTDLIAEVDTRAQDMADEQGNDAVPRVDEVDEYERIAALPSTPSSQPGPPVESPEPIELPEPEPPEPEPVAPEPAETEPVEPESVAPEPAPRTLEEPIEQEADRQRPVERPEERTEDPPEHERTEVAQAPPDAQAQRPRQDNPILREPGGPETPADASEPSRGRMQGAVMNKGFLGFEAMQDEIAPYLRHVQEKVERRWRLTMELEYRGAARARAVVDCAIKPDGELAFVRIHDDGGNPAYAAACANAIREAAPFGAFPFEVPTMYREEEIMIRWTFQFM